MDAMRDRFRGCLIGLAVGDALGTTLEFRSPGTFEPIDDMIGGGPFGLEPGEWTDDTSMALCLAQSLIECKGFDPADQMQRYVRWWTEGYMSSNGDCFDIGNTVQSALSHFRSTSEPFSGPKDQYSAGNGSLMRLAPIPMAFAAKAEEAIARAADSSRTTHGAEEAIDACRYYAGLTVLALQGANKEEILEPRACPVEDLWNRSPLAHSIDEIASGSFLEKEPPEIVGSGYVVKAIEAALWAFAKSSSFKEGALLAVNLGDDADTTGAIYGQLAGALYGYAGIPVGWREVIAMGEEIVSMADELFEFRLNESSGI